MIIQTTYTPLQSLYFTHGGQICHEKVKKLAVEADSPGGGFNRERYYFDVNGKEVVKWKDDLYTTKEKLIRALNYN